MKINPRKNNFKLSLFKLNEIMKGLLLRFPVVKEQKEQEEIRLGGTDPEHEYKEVLYIFHFQSGKMTETLYLRQKINN